MLCWLEVCAIVMSVPMEIIVVNWSSEGFPTVVVKEAG